MKHHTKVEKIQGTPLIRSVRGPSVHAHIDKICGIPKDKAIAGNIIVLPLSADMPPSQVICTCSYCSKCTITVEGSRQPGSLVSIPTRREHERKDKRPTLHMPEHSVSSRSVPNNPRDPNPRKGVRRS